MDYFSLTNDFVLNYIDPFDTYDSTKILDLHKTYLSSFHINPSWKNRSDVRRLKDISNVDDSIHKLLPITIDNIPYYAEYTQDFINTFLKKDKYGFVTKNALLNHHATYLWFNSIKQYPILNADSWADKTKHERLLHLSKLIGSLPRFSEEFINIGWSGYTLYDTHPDKIKTRIKCKNDWNLYLNWIVTQNHLIGKNIDIVYDIFNKKYNEKNYKKISMNNFKKIVKRNYSIKNNKIYG
jgi:hypothetical protein